MKTFYISLVSALLLVGCAGEDPAEDSSSESISTESTNSEEDAMNEEVQEALEGLELNDGNKWKVDISTDEGMNEVREMVNNFDGDDSKQLGKDIKKRLKGITKECDMVGEDHNQYHILLKAMMDEAKQLKKGKSTDPSKIERYLEAYDGHFEVGELE